ncbi:MAG: hypothetical protein QOI34_667 [Verrucomicrobiota bacterium]
MIEKKNRPRLLEFLDRADDGIEIRPIAGVELGMDKVAMSANFKRTATRRNQSERFDALAQFENFGRQTDSLRRVVSDYTIFDRHLGFHRELPSLKKVSAGRNRVKNRPSLLERVFRMRN